MKYGAKTSILAFASTVLITGQLASTRSASAGYVWQEIVSAGASAPSARYDHAMVYDSTRQQALLFGGRNTSMFFDDLWQWDSATAAWTPLSPQGGVKPSARYGHAMAYDNIRDRVVVFGGWDSSGRRNDLWEWDPAQSTWTAIVLPGPLPAARLYHGMAYDIGRAQMVLYGGSGAAGALGDTWEWNGNQASPWVFKSSLTCLPGLGMCPRFDFGMAYNGTHIVLFGGTDGFNCSSANSNYDSFDFTFEWNGTAWGIDPQTGPNPDRRFKHEFVWDSVSGDMVLYGGTTIACTPGGGVESDTWGWDNAADWVVHSASSGFPRAGHAMVFDETIGGAGGVILHGGFDASQLHGNTLVGYEIPGGTTGACPPAFDLQNPSTYRHRLFEVTGTASGQPWSWSISWGGFTIYEPFVPGVTPGGSAADLAAAFVASINSQSCAGNQLAAYQGTGSFSSHFRIVIGGSQTPHLCVGPANQPTTCCVSTVNSCPFNPELSEVLLSGEDCNMNGMDDTIDLLSAPDLDVDGNGVIDSCESPPGDLNCDTAIDGRDIVAYVLAVTNPPGYEDQYPACDIANADLDGDGLFTEIDTAILIELLIN